MKKLFYFLIIPLIVLGQCDEGEYPISISTTTGEWAFEMAWGLWDYNTWMETGPENNNALALFLGENNYETISFEACLPNDGCYIIGGYDSYGDGWNDGYIVVPPLTDTNSGMIGCKPWSACNARLTWFGKVKSL